MKTKTFLLIAILSISFLNSDAQINKWLNKQKKKLQQNEFVQKAQESAKQLDPREYLKRKINENFYLSKYVNDVTKKYDQLKVTLHNNVSLYNNSNNKFQNEFYRTNSMNNQLVYVESGVINSINPVTVNYSNAKYNLYQKDNLLVAVSEGKMPVNNDLENIIKTSYWSSQTKNLNASYIQNLKNLAKLNGEFYGYMLLFYDGCSNVFDKIDNLGYGGITASTLIDEYSKMLGYNFSISETRSTFNSYRDQLKEMQNLSNRIDQSCNTFLISRKNLINTGNASYDDVQNSLKSFNSISTDINTLADQVEKQKQAIAGTRRELSRLSNFYGISFIESIGNLYKYLEDYYSMIEDGTRKHANNFNKFVEDVNTESNQLYASAKAEFDKIAEKQLKEELPYVAGYLSIQKDITASEFKNLPQDKYVQYLNKITSLNTNLTKAKDVDFVEFHNIKSELRQQYDNFPVENAQNYYSSVLSKIDSKQIIGGKYREKYVKDFNAKIALMKDDKSKINAVVSLNQNLDSYYKSAKTNNIIFFSILFGVLAISVLIIFFLQKKKKKTELKLKGI